jgi:hypothetical protein
MTDSAIEPAFDERLHDRRIGERAGVAEVGEIILGDLPEDAAHDLAAAGLGQAGGDVEVVGHGDAADFVADGGAQFGEQRIGGGDAGVEGDIGVDALPLYVMGEADDGGFGDVLVRDECRFDFGDGPRR